MGTLKVLYLQWLHRHREIYMLQTFREYSGGIFAKIIFGLIIASFALFGVGDMFQSYTNRHPVVTVGGTNISPDEFRHSYDQMLRNVQTVFKGKISPEQIQTLKLSTRVLEELVNKTLLQNNIKDFGLMVSNETLAHTVRSIPAFHNENGVFDEGRFREIISSHGHSESSFMNQVKLDLQQQQLFLPLARGVTLPVNYQEKLYKALHQEFVFETVYIPFSSLKITEQPQQTELESLYKKSSELFTRPEYRDVQLLVVNPAAVRETIHPTEEQIQEEYQRRQAEFVIPETRFVIQSTFNSKEMGTKALARIVAGEPIEVVTRELGGQLKSFPTANRDQFSHAHADLIFKGNQPFTTELVDSLFGWSIFSIAQITPESQKPLESVKETVVQDLIIRLSSEKMDDLRNKIEDELAGGGSLDNVAKNYGLETIRIWKIAKNGQNDRQESVIPADYRTLVLENAFSLDAGVGTPLLDGPQGKMVVVHVHGITPKTLPPFDEIRSEVKKYWVKMKQQEAATKKASDLTKEATSSAILADLAKKNGYVIKTLPPLSLTSLQEDKTVDDTVSAAALQKGFKLKVNQADFVPAREGVAVIMPKNILPFTLKKEDEKWQKFGQYLHTMFVKDFQTEYMAALKSAQKVDINQALVDRITSTDGHAGSAEGGENL